MYLEETAKEDSKYFGECKKRADVAILVVSTTIVLSVVSYLTLFTVFHNDCSHFWPSFYNTFGIEA